MAFPGIVGTPATYADNTGLVSNHAVTLPSSLVDGNKCWLAFIGNGSPTITTPTSWNLLASNSTPGTYDSIRIYGRDIDSSWSSSTTVTVALSANQRAAAISFQTDGGRAGFTASEMAISLVENGGGVTQLTTADPPNLSPGWSPAEDVLWAAFGFGHDGNSTFSSYPTNYNLGQTSVQNGAGNGNAIAFAARQLNALSEDPGVFTWSNTKFRAAATLAIRPAAAAVSGARSFGFVIG